MFFKEMKHLTTVQMRSTFAWVYFTRLALDILVSVTQTPNGPSVLRWVGDKYANV